MKKNVESIDVNGKTVIVRGDFNVPLDEDGNITDDARIKGALPTINYLLENNAKIILISHLGRPKGKYDMKRSLKPVADAFEKELNRPIIFDPHPEVLDEKIKQEAKNLKPGQILLLENIRFRKEEEQNDPTFAKELASLGDIFVNDAFGTAHRAHASNAGIAAYLPSVSGFLVEKELKFFGDALDNPKRPFVAILGGAKVNDKIKVIDSLIDKADTLLIGGGMGYTFLKASGKEVGRSLVDEPSLLLAKELMERAKHKGVELLLPVDIHITKEFSNDGESTFCDSDKIPNDMQGLDAGPKTIKLYGDKIKEAGTVLWNGPVGVFEMPNYSDGTRGISEAMAEAKGITIIGGGDSAAAVNKFGLADKMTHVSTGGGASLALIEGQKLPGITPLQDK